MGPNAGHPASKIDAAEIKLAVAGVKRFECKDDNCDIFKRRNDRMKQEVIDELKAWIIANAPKVTNGKDGSNGVDGKPGRDGKDGADGKTYTRAEVMDMIRELFDERAATLKGKDGADGKPGANGTVNVRVKMMDGKSKQFDNLSGGTVEYEIKQDLERVVRQILSETGSKK